MGGRALGALGPAHQARECRPYSRPTHGLYRDPRGPGGKGAGQGFRGPPEGQGGPPGVQVPARGTGGQPGFQGQARGQHGTW